MKFQSVSPTPSRLKWGAKYLQFFVLFFLKIKFAIIIVIFYSLITTVLFDRHNYSNIPCNTHQQLCAFRDQICSTVHPVQLSMRLTSRHHRNYSTVIQKQFTQNPLMTLSLMQSWRWSAILARWIWYYYQVIVISCSIWTVCACNYAAKLVWSRKFNYTKLSTELSQLIWLQLAFNGLR